MFTQIRNMPFTCWCTSGLPVEQCHGATQTPWALPAVPELRFHWDNSTDQTTRSNVINYLQTRTAYHPSTNLDCLSISCPPLAWTFFSQSLFASGPNPHGD